MLDEESRLLLPNSLTVLRLLQQQLQNNSDEPLAIFLGGVIGYDLVAMVEDLPQVPTAENQCPDYLFYLAETLLVVDHQALFETLQARRIWAAGLDVTEPEPLPRDHSLLGLDNVIIMPHLGSATHQTRQAMAQRSVDNLRAGLEGKPLLSRVA